ncbi:hypothetical protein VUR80DRAFT_4595 [Thermomyces stellatus]
MRITLVRIRNQYLRRKSARMESERDGVGKWVVMEVRGRPDLFVGGRDQVLIQQELCTASLSDKYRGTSPANAKSVSGGGACWAAPRQPRFWQWGGLFLRESPHKPHHNISQRGNFWGFAPRTNSQSRVADAISFPRDSGMRRDALPDGAPQPRKGSIQ